MQRLRLELEKRSKTGQLTGLFNKQATEEMIAQVLERTGHTDGGGALLMIDVDKFKFVNDTFGHIAGDRVLMTIGDTILRIAARMSDKVVTSSRANPSGNTSRFP